MEWMRLLEDHHIQYTTSGPNTKKGEISVKCPWCGVDDPSEHMGISLNHEAWGCLRNGVHRGKQPHRLVQAILGCSFSQAKLAVSQYSTVDPDTMDGFSGFGISELAREPVQVPDPIMPETFREIRPDGLTARFFNYLKRRGFEQPEEVIKCYDLMGCLAGRFQGRLIIPIFSHGKLKAWTARALNEPLVAPRYLTEGDIKTTIFNEDWVMEGGNVLFITEGPFDAIKMDFYGSVDDAKATCVFGTSITVDQISLLRQASSRFEKTVMLLDTDAIEQTFYAMDWLPKAVIGQLPDGVKDPGELSKDEIKTLITNM